MVRLNSIQALRAVAALVVVIFHFNSVEIDLGGKVEVPFFSLFYFFGYGGVDLFFVISGFIITWVHYREIGNPTHATSYFRKRLVRLLPVYCAVWLVAAWISYQVLQDNFCVETGTFWNLVQTASLSLGVQNCFVPQAWSLSWELLFYCVFLVFFFMRRSTFAPALFLWALTIAVVHGLGLVPLKGYAVLSPLNLQFIGGCLIALTALRDETRFAMPSLIVGLIWVAVSIVLNAAGLMSVDLDWHRVAEYGVASMFIVYGLVALEIRAGGESKFPSWLVELGNASYSIYLTHITTFLALRHLLAGMPHTVMSHAAYAMMLIGPAVLIGWLVYRYIETPILSAFRGVKSDRQNFGYVAACLLLAIAGAAVITRSYDQIIPPALAYDGGAVSLENEGSKTVLKMNGSTLTMTAERQGWVADVKRAGNALELSGWALDRERNRTAIAVLAFVDGHLTQTEAPIYQFRAVEPGITFVDGHRPGFRLTVPNAVGRDVRLFALLPDNRVGELYYPTDFPPK